MPILASGAPSSFSSSAEWESCPCDKEALASDILGPDDGAARVLTEMTDDDLLRFVSLDLRSAG